MRFAGHTESMASFLQLHAELQIYIFDLLDFADR